MAVNSNIVFGVDMDTSGINRGIKSIDNQLKGLAATAVAAFAAINVTGLIKETTMTAMSVDSAMNNIEFTLKESSKSFDRWVEGVSESYGIARDSAYQFGGSFTSMISSFMDGTENVAAYSTNLLETIAVISSRTGRTYDDVSERILSGLRGETEAIEDLSIYVSASMIQSTQAFKKFAGDKSWNQLDDKTKRLITLFSILEQSQARYGTEVVDTTSAKHGQLVASLKNMRLALGEAFMPIYETIIPSLNALVESMGYVIQRFSEFTNKVFGKEENAMSKQADDAKQASINMSEFGDETEEAGKKAKKAMKNLQGFDTLNRLSLKEEKDESESESTFVIPQREIKKGTEEVKEQSKWISILDDSIGNLKKQLEPSLKALKDFREKGLKPLKDFAWTGLKDFYERFLVPIGKWTLGEGIPRFVDAITNQLAKVDWNRLNGSFVTLWNSLTPFAIMVGEGLLWFWENALTPLIGWAIDNMLPLALELLAKAFDFLGSIIESAKPTFIWLFENVLVPLANYAGDVVVAIFEGMISIFGKLTEFITNNQEIMDLFFSIVIGFLSGLAFYYGTVKVIAIINGIKDALYLFFLMFATHPGLSSLQVAAIAIGVLGAGIVYLGQNWDKLNGAGKAASILGGLVAAALAAAVAIGVFHASWSVGLAAMAIAGGIGLIVSTFAALKLGGTNGVSTDLDLDSPQNTASSKPSSAVAMFGSTQSNFDLPKLAKGGLIPPNNPRAVIVGDNMVEDEIVSPVSTMQNALREVLKEFNMNDGSSNSESIHILRQILAAIREGHVVVLNEREVARTVMNANRSNRRQTGNFY